ncbi:MAG TPA: autotransporter-associated beta strand repeat-containing protein [Tepidisphaeraceae bacterium]|jgi:autotransporter-associated beta strand protein/T5SS/PEP-CTERM-associated repeat protein|nr:autotransporter-associated beta strand repeat-containing protein [Tepidisphaeraceae bacterium]
MLPVFKRGGRADVLLAYRNCVGGCKHVRGRSARRAALALTLAVGSGEALGQTAGQNLSWAFAQSGVFSNGLNWSPTFAPTSVDTVIFNTHSAAAYTVSVAASASVDQIMIEKDQLTFDLGGHTLSGTNTDQYGLYVGMNSGDSATLHVTNGTLQVQQADIGRSGAQGTVIVDTGGVLDMASIGQYGLLSVGAGGTGTLMVQNGGVVDLGTQSPYGLHIGGQPRFGFAGTGTVTITGMGSALNMTAPMYAGSYYTGGNGSFTVAAGATATTTDAWIGYYDATTGAATLTGVGSSWTVNGGVFVGGEQQNLSGATSPAGHGTLLVQNGAALTANQLSVDGSASLTSAGSLISILNGDEQIGNSGVGVFNQSNGINSIVNTLNALYLGNNPGSAGTYLLSGGQLNSGHEYVGHHAAGTFIQTGGTNTISSNLIVGFYPDGTGTYSLSAGSLTAVTASAGSPSGGIGTLNIGGGSAVVSGALTVYSGTGDSILLSGGSLSVGTLDTQSNSSHFHWTGGNLSFTNTPTLTIGPGTTLGNGVILPTGSTLASTGSIVVASLGSLGGQGTVTAPVTIASGGHLAPGNTVGAINLNSLTMSSGSFLDVDLGTASDVVNILNPGALTLNGGSINIIVGSGFGTGTYTLLDYSGSFSGNVTNLTIGNVPSGYSYSLTNNANNTSIDLHVVPLISGSSSWGVDASGVWLSSPNWAGGIVPNAASQVATFGPVITANRTVTVGSAQTVGSLVFNSPYSYTLQGSFATTLSSTGGSTVSVLNGNDFIASPLVLSGATTFNMSGGSLTVSGNLTGSAAGSITKSGTGNLELSGTLALATNFPINITAGTATFDSNPGLSSLTINSGATAVVNSTAFSPVSTTIASGGTLTVNQNITNNFTVHANGGTISVGTGVTYSPMGISLNSSGLTKTGSGTLKLPVLNLFDTPVTVAAGTLNAPSLNLAGSTFTQTGGTITQQVTLRADDSHVGPTLVLGAGAGSASYLMQGPGAIVGNIPAAVSVNLNSGSNGDATWTVSSPFTNAGNLQITDTGGELSQTLKLDAGSTGTITNTGNFNVAATQSYVELGGNFVNAASGVTNFSTSAETSGNFTNAGALNLVNGGYLQVDLEINGTFNQTGGTLLSNDNVTISGGTFNYSGGSVVGNVELFQYYNQANQTSAIPNLNITTTTGTGIFNFQSQGIVTGNIPATMTVVAENGTVTTPASMTNAGVFEAGNSLIVGPNGTGTITNNGTLLVNVDLQGSLVNTSTGTANLACTVNNLTNAGTVNVESFGTVDVAGTFAQSAGGVTTVPQYGTLQVEGAMNLSGGSIILTSWYTPARLITSEINYTGTSSPALIDTTGSIVDGQPGEIDFQGSSLPINVADGSAANDLTINASIVGDGPIIKTGAGTLVLGGYNGGITGGVTIQEGTVSISNDESLGDNGEPLTFTGGTLTISQSLAIARPVVVSNATINVPTGLKLTMQGVWSGFGPLNKTGAGILEMDGSAAGLTTTTISAGTLRTGSVNAIGNLQTLSISLGAIFDTNGFSQTLNTIAGSGSVLLSFGDTLSLGNGNASSSFSGSISGEGSISKIGTGIVTLSGSNAYTAQTNVIGGTLRLGSNAALPQTTTVVISSALATLDLAGHSTTIDAVSGNAGSVSNSTATLSTLTLTPASTDSNTFAGSITGAIAVNMLGDGAQSFTGANSFTGGLSVTGGTLTLTSAGNSFTGGVLISGASGQIGTLALNSDGALGSLANSITLDGGRLQAISSFSTSRNFAISSNSTIDVPAAGNTLTYSGVLSGAGGLTKTGLGALLFTSSSPGFTSPITLTGGSIRLAGSAGTLASSSISLGVGTTFQLDNSSSGNNSNRLSDSANIVLNGGTFSYLGANSTASTESLGQLIPQSGGSTVSLVAGNGGTTAVTFSALGTRGAGATVNFQAVNIGSTNKVLFSTPPLVVAGDPVSGNLGSWATVNGTDWAKYSVTGGVIPFALTDYSNDLLIPDTHVRLTITPAAIGNLSIRTLNLAANGSAALNITQNAGTTLELTHGGLLHAGAQPSTISGGTIQSDDGVFNVYSSGGDLRLAGVIGESTPLTDFVKAGPGTVYLGGGASDTAANTFTGVTRVEGGTLVLDKAQGTYAIPGGLEVSGGTLLVNRPGQINPNAPVSLSGGTFDLNGQTESFNTFTNSGGMLLFHGGTLTVNDITLSGGTTIVASNLIAGSFEIINSSDNQIHAGGTITVTGTTSFSGTGSPGITIYAGATPGKLTLGGNLTFDGASGTAAIVTTTPASGETAGVIDLGSAARTFTINDGTDTVDMRISTVIQSGSLVKAGAGTLRLEAVNTYAGGTTLSAGTLEADSPGALGTGGVTFSSTATLLLRSDTNVTFNNPITVSSSTKDISLDIERNTAGTTPTFTASSLTLGKSLTLAGTTGGTLRFPGNVSLQANTTLNNSATLDFEGAISGGFTVTKTLPGTLVFGGTSANTYTGLTTVNSGLVQLSKTAGLNAIPAGLTVNGPATVQLLANNEIADASAIALNGTKGAAVLDLNNFNDTVSTLNFTAGGTVQTGGGVLTITGDVVFSGAANSGLISGNLQMAGSGPRHFNVADGSAATDLEISANINGSQGLVKDGAGRLLLDGSNNFTGGITVNAGSIYITNDSALNSNAVTLAGGTLVSSGSLNTSVAISSASSLDTPDSLTLMGTISGSAGVTKMGTGTVTLMGDNSMTGPISVTGGVLAIPNDDALGQATTITVSNATLRATSSLSAQQPVTASTGGATLDVSSGATLSLSGGIGGSGSVTKTGAGTLSLGNSVTTTGLTTVSQGSLNLDFAQTFAGGVSLGTATINVDVPSSVTGSFTSTGSGVINHNANAFTLSGTGNTSFAGNLRISGATGGSVIFARTGGTASAAAGSSIQIDAGAKLALTGSSSVFSVTNPMALNNDSIFTVSAGSNTLGALTGSGSTSVTGGVLSTTVLRQIGMSISGTGSVIVRPATTANSTSSTSLFTSLSILGSGSLDLGNDSLVLDYAKGATSPATTIRQYLLTGSASGAWTGPGIKSSSAATSGTTAIAYVEASDLLGLSGSATATWSGQTVDASSILLKYTYAGDANLDGKITADDYALIDRGAAKHLSSWVYGDFNYDGVVNSADYMLIDKSFALQNGALSPDLLAQREAQFGDVYVSQLLSSIPEPSIGLGGLIAAASMFGSRRRRLSH